jgi:hypothetical protein
MQVGQTGSSATTPARSGATAPEASGVTAPAGSGVTAPEASAASGDPSWCPRCDDLAATAPGTPCTACATPRAAIGPTRDDAAPFDLANRLGLGGRRPLATPPRRPAGAPALGSPGAGGGPAGPGDRRPVAALGPELAAPAALGPEPAAPAALDLESAVPAGLGLEPAAPALVVTGSVGPGWSPAGAGRPVPEGLDRLSKVLASGRPAAGAGGSGRRWLVGLLALGLVLGAVAARGPGFAPAERRPPAAAPAPATTVAQPGRQQATDPLSGFPVVPEPAARPGRALPTRGPAPVSGAAGSMIVRYGGWLWRQRLAGGPAAPVGPIPGTPVAALSPDGRQLALVHAVRGRQVVEVRTLDGHVQRVVNGSGPAWSRDGRLAYVRTPGSQRAVTMSMSLSRRVPGPELRVVGDGVWSTVPLPSTLGSARAGWTGDGKVLLLGRDRPMAGLFRVDVARNRLESLSPTAGGEALALGLPRAADASGPLGNALAGTPPLLVALAPDGRKVALVTRAKGGSRLEVAGPSGRVRIDLPVDRFRSVHWAPAGNLVWLHGTAHLWAVHVATRRVAGGTPGLPRGATVLGLVP